MTRRAGEPVFLEVLRHLAKANAEILARLRVREFRSVQRAIPFRVGVARFRERHFLVRPYGARDELRELGQEVTSTTYSFRQGDDAWVVVDFNCPNPDLVNRLVDSTQGARHLFLVTHGPLVFSDSGSFRWSLFGAPKYNEVRRALIAKLMRRRAIILAGHTHVIDFKRLRSSEGELTQFITSAVWTNEEMAFSKPAATTPKEYGESTGPQLTSERARDDFHTCIGEVKPNLVEYSLTRAAGHATLSVTDASVKATFYPGDSRKPGQVFELVS